MKACMGCECCDKLATYNLLCVDCCARLVLSVRPLKAKAEAMLAAIKRMPGAPLRADVLARVREKLSD